MTTTQKPDYSIELSHIYTNERYSNEHRNSIVLLQEHNDSFNHTSRQTCIMIDNYNPTEHLLDINDFFNLLAQDNLKPDYFAFEANMIKHKDRLLDSITDNKLRKSYQHYADKKDKMPCSFMTAVWYLVRLGFFDGEGIVESLNGSFMPAKELINILPERFRSVEMQTQRLIQSIDDQNLVGKIDYYFY